VFIGVEKKVTIVKKVTDRNLKGYRSLFTDCLPLQKKKTSMKIAVEIIVIPSLQKKYIRELKQQRRRRLQKRHLKSEFAPLQTLSRLFHLVYFVKCWQMFLELNSKGLYQSSGKEKESCCLVFPSSTKREFRHFHVVVGQ